MASSQNEHPSKVGLLGHNTTQSHHIMLAAFYYPALAFQRFPDDIFAFFSFFHVNELASENNARWAWCRTPLIAALRGQRHMHLCETQVSLVYIAELSVRLHPKSLPAMSSMNLKGKNLLNWICDSHWVLGERNPKKMWQKEQETGLSRGGLEWLLEYQVEG